MKSKKVLLTVCWLTLVIIAHSCRKEDPPTIPVVESVIITDITQTTAIGGGQIVTDGGKPVTKRGVCWGVTNQPTINDNKTTDGTGDGSFVSSITGLTPGVLYYVRAYATNGVGTGYGDPVSFKTNPVVQAEITTTIISDIITNSAKSGGTIVSNGGGEITSCGVCWSLNHEPKITDDKTTDALSGNSFISILTNLEYFKTYYVRAYATNLAGTVYGNEREFTTAAAPPTVTTSEVTNKNYRSATVGGEVTADGGKPVTDKGICFATHTNPKFNENNKTAGNGLGTFTVDISGLEPNTVYHVRAYAATAADTAYGENVSFETLETTIPVITTHTIYGTTNCTATSGGEIMSDGGEPILSKGICWSSTKLEPTISDESGNWGAGSSSFVASLQNLTPGTGYYLRAYATNSIGIGYGTVLSFSTPCNPPMIYEQRALEVFSTSARLLTTTDLAESAIFFLTNTSTGGILTIDPQGSGNPCGVNSFIVDATGLERGTTYSCEVHAVNICAGMVSSPFTFTTLDVPTLTTATPSEVTSNSVVTGGNISSDGGSNITERGLCWSTNENPTTSDNHITVGSGIGDFSATINGLDPNTTYFVRAYAINSVGVNYGSQVQFKTEPFAVGQNYGGGIIFYIDDTGKHGLIAAPNNYAWDRVWSNTPQPVVTGATGTAIGTGLSNTMKIVGALGNTESAASACYDLVLNGYDDWYLPSRDELTLLYANMAIIGGFIELSYWSSTETGIETARSVDFSSGLSYSSIKTARCKVRPIRSF